MRLFFYLGSDMNFLMQGRKKNKKGSKKTIFMIIIISVLLISIATTANSKTAQVTNQQTELSIDFVGSVRLLFLPAVGYAVNNIGNEIAENVIGQFTVEGGLTGNINFDVTYDFNDIDPDHGLIVSYPHAIDGFGFVTVNVDVTCDNAEPISKTARGLQIGMRTFIFG